MRFLMAVCLLTASCLPPEETFTYQILVDGEVVWSGEGVYATILDGCAVVTGRRQAVKIASVCSERGQVLEWRRLIKPESQ